MKIANVCEKDCVACGSCVPVCPRSAIQVYRGSYIIIDDEKCVGCSLCAKKCPASVITIESRGS